MIRAMLFWRFADAPEHLRKLSTNGGDEDYLVLVPPGVEPPYWMEDDGWVFGSCGVEKIELPDGHTVLIGSHA